MDVHKPVKIIHDIYVACDVSLFCRVALEDEGIANTPGAIGTAGDWTTGGLQPPKLQFSFDCAGKIKIHI